jgi:allophanate hydrolase subunit 2
VYVPAGALLEIGPALRGVRCSIAIAGGVLADLVLGSRSTDLLSGLGPAPLRDGDRLAVGTPPPPPPGADVHPVSAPPDSEIELPVLPGPRAQLFEDGAWRELTRAGFRVKPQSNRIALRLDGPPLARSATDAIPSEGAVLGAIQVPADGLPIVFLADHPPTGGYPVIGVVPGSALHLAAQAVPGTRVRFRAAR